MTRGIQDCWVWRAASSGGDALACRRLAQAARGAARACACVRRATAEAAHLIFLCLDVVLEIIQFVLARHGDSGAGGTAAGAAKARATHLSHGVFCAVEYLEPASPGEGGWCAWACRAAGRERERPDQHVTRVNVKAGTRGGSARSNHARARRLGWSEAPALRRAPVGPSVVRVGVRRNGRVTLVPAFATAPHQEALLKVGGWPSGLVRLRAAAPSARRRCEGTRRSPSMQRPETAPLRPPRARPARLCPLSPCALLWILTVEGKNSVAS